MILSLLAACRREPSPEGPPPPTPGVLRVGPAAPSVGIYGIAAAKGKVYVSNLHVPWLTVVDPATGAAVEHLELRTASGARPMFPRLSVVGDELWITAASEGVVLRLSLPDHQRLPDLELPQSPVAFRAVEDGLWVAAAASASHLTAEGIVEAVPLDWRVSALDVEGDLVVGVDPRGGEILAFDRSGAPQWTLALDAGELGDVRVVDGVVFASDRASGDVFRVEDGVLIERVHAGSDTFSLTPLDGDLLVVNRQGAGLPASGAYEGAGGLLQRRRADLSEKWSVELDKTIHFIAREGGGPLWLANEDALRLSAVDAETGEELLRGPRVGMTLDHLSVVGDRVFAGSHLTDELWVVDLELGTAEVVPTCGWPFQAVVDGASAWVPCQESGEVQRVDLQSLEIGETLALADTFHSVCEAGLCTGHSGLVAAALVAGELVIGDPHTGALRWLDGRILELPAEERGDSVQHWGIAELEGRLIALEPSRRRIYALDGGEVVAQRAAPTELGPFPLVLDGERVWAGALALDAGLQEVASVPAGVVVAAGAGGVVAVEDGFIVLYSAEDLEERARLAFEDLRAPPILGDGTPEPMRFALRGDELLVANTFQGTLERRSMLDLSPLGSDALTVVECPTGAW